MLDDGRAYDHEAKTPYEEPGVIAKDSLDGDISDKIVTGGEEVDPDTLGKYVITYNVTDAAGNAAATRTRTVSVVDSTAPVITLTGPSQIYHERGLLYNDLGAVASDTLDGDLTNLIETTGEVNVYRLGDYPLTYSVSDSQGNYAEEVIRLVSVVRGEAKETEIDFNGDGLKDDFVIISFTNDNWPDNVDVQFGDPYIDPIGDLNESEFGSISGRITDENGNPIPEFEIRLLDAEAEDPLTNLVVYQLETKPDGTYLVNAPVGSYFLEAYGSDSESGINYNAQFYGSADQNTFGEVISIDDAGTPVEGINLVLVQEYVPLPDKGQVIGNVLSESAKGIEGAFIEFYPLDPDDKKMLSDHPVVRAWTDSSGAFKADLPNGDWGLMVNHPDRTKESGWVTITVMGDVENAGNIVLKNRPVATLTGSIKGPDGEAVLARLELVSKENQEIIESPTLLDFLEDPATGQLTGNFTAAVPVGEYFIKIIPSDLYKSGFYSSEGIVLEIQEASPVAISSGGLSKFDIVLTKNNLVDVFFKVTDHSNGVPIEDITIGFFDPQEELEAALYLSGEELKPFDGNYFCRVPANSYRVGIFAPTHLPAFLRLDGEGDPVWSAKAWWEASPISIELNNEYDFGSLTMTEMPTDPSLDWYDPNAGDGGVLEGIVISPSSSVFLWLTSLLFLMAVCFACRTFLRSLMDHS